VDKPLTKRELRAMGLLSQGAFLLSGVAPKKVFLHGQWVYPRRWSLLNYDGERIADIGEKTLRGLHAHYPFERVARYRSSIDPSQYVTWWVLKK
jgi:hypothetical protein